MDKRDIERLILECIDKNQDCSEDDIYKYCASKNIKGIEFTTFLGRPFNRDVKLEFESLEGIGFINRITESCPRKTYFRLTKDGKEIFTHLKEKNK